MNRQLSALLLLSIALVPVRESEGAPRPNILLIVGEDHGCELSCYGDTCIQTPHIDKLAEEGILYRNGYITQPVCSPSRSSIFTGLYPHANGMLGLATHNFNYFRRWPTTYALLKQAGYRTGLIGKTHVNPAAIVEDYVDFRYQKGANFSKRNVADYARKAGEFFRQQSDKPFFMTVNYPDAHWPLQADRVDGLPGKLADPETIKILPYVTSAGETTPRLTEITKNYYNCMLRLDDCVGQLLGELEASGKADDTLVVFIGDHGAQMARGKIFMYEAGTRVPYIAHWPGRITPGQRSDALVSANDLLPTFMAAAGAADRTPSPMHGKSLLPTFKDAPDNGQTFRPYLFCERNVDGAHYAFPQRTIRDQRFKLIYTLVDKPDPAAITCRAGGKSHWSGGLLNSEMSVANEVTRKGYDTWLNPPTYQLYDLKTDPHEWHDLANDPRYQEYQERLKREMRRWQEETDDPLRDPAKLKMLMDECETVVQSGKRSPKGGWQYLKYLAPKGVSDVQGASPSPTRVTGAPEIVKVMDLNDLTVAGKPGVERSYKYLREPNAVVTRDGTLVVVAGSHHVRARNDRAHQDALCRRSKDGGRTWSEITMIADVGMESVLPTVLVYDEERDRVLFVYNIIFNDAERPKEEKRPCQQFVIHSDDAGATWSAPREILKDLSKICVFGGGNGFRLKHGKRKGRLVIPGGTHSGGFSRGCYTSDDHGETWQFRKIALQGRLEASGCELKDGTIMLNHRQSGYGMAATFSRDEGETWSDQVSILPDAWSACNNSALTAYGARGKEHVLIAAPLGPENAARYVIEQDAEKLKRGVEDSRQKARCNGGVFLSLDGGKTWPSGVCVTPGWTFGYNALVALPNREIGLLFEGSPSGVAWQKAKRDHNTGARLGIYMVRFSLSWLVKQQKETR